MQFRAGPLPHTRAVHRTNGLRPRTGAHRRTKCPRCLPAEDNNGKGLSVRVQHPTQLNIEPEILWGLLRAELPDPQAWNDVAVVLASLESLYRFEYLLAAEEAIACFNAANAAEVPRSDDQEAARQEKQPWLRGWRRLKQQQQQQKKKQNSQPSQTRMQRGQRATNQQQTQQSQEQQDSVQGGDNAESSATATAAAVFDAAATAAAVAAAATGANNIMQQQQQQQQQQPSLSPEDKLRLNALEKDRELADWVLFLASHSHFQALSRRDCEIARTLNQGYLAQLFIQSDASTLDGNVVQAFEQQAGSSMPGPAEEAASRHAWDARLGDVSGSEGLGGLMQSGGQEKEVASRHTWDARLGDGRGSEGLGGLMQSGGQEEDAASRHAWDARVGGGSGSEDQGGLMRTGGQEGGEVMATNGSSSAADNGGNNWREGARGQGSGSRGSMDDGDSWSAVGQSGISSNSGSISITSSGSESGGDGWSESGGTVDYNSSHFSDGDGDGWQHQGGNGSGPSLLASHERQSETQQFKQAPHSLATEEERSEKSRSSGSSRPPWSARTTASGDGDEDLPFSDSSVDSSSPQGVGCALPISQTGLSKAESEVMEDAGMLIFKRGFGREQVRGRLILAKLDFLQTALVEELLEAARSSLQELLRKSKQSASKLLESQRSEEEERKRSQGDFVPSIFDRLTEAASRAIIWLSERGVAPITDVLQLWELDELHPLREPPRLTPLKLRVVGLKESLGAKSILQQDFRELTRSLLQPTELEEPTFEEIAVVYRRKPQQQRRGFWGRLRHTLSKAGQRLRLIPPSLPGPSTITRPPINLQIYKDVPLPTWQVVLPEKILQFRPLDFLRTDLFAVAGLIALFAQARYDSLYLELVTGVSAIVFLVRIFLGYQRMEQRYRVRLSEVLREKTVATDTTALEYLAASAASQQFKQAALAYVLLLQDQQHHHHFQQQHQQCQGQGSSHQGHFHASNGMTESMYGHTSTGQPEGTQTQNSQQQVDGSGLEGLAARAEHLLLQRCGLKVRFDVEQAMAELLRQGLVRAEAPATTVAPAEDVPVLVQQKSETASSSSAGLQHVQEEQGAGTSSGSAGLQHAQEEQEFDRSSRSTDPWRAQGKQQAGTASSSSKSSSFSSSSGSSSSGSISSSARFWDSSGNRDWSGRSWDGRDWRRKGLRVEPRSPTECAFHAVEPGMALQRVEQQWRSILWQRVDGQLRRVQHRMEGGQR